MSVRFWPGAQLKTDFVEKSVDEGFFQEFFLEEFEKQFSQFIQIYIIGDRDYRERGDRARRAEQ